MIDFAHEWKIQDACRHAPASADEWDKRSDTFSAADSPSAYVEAFIERCELNSGETVLDMGCGAGSIAIPLARSGYTVYAADFSCGMLDKLSESAKAESLTTIHPMLMSWEDVWQEHGLGEKSVDVAIASRSIMVSDLADALSKLSQVARKRVCITAGTGLSPKVDPRVARAMGIVPKSYNDALFVVGVAFQLGYTPSISYIYAQRRRSFDSYEAAYEHLLKTITYADPQAGPIDIESAAEGLRHWLDAHLIRTELLHEDAASGAHACAETTSIGAWSIDTPSMVPWAFISWDTH